VTFRATDSSGGNATAAVTVQVDSGAPVVTGIVNAASRSADAACSPGAIAAIQGRWLTSGAPAADSSGGSLELAGARVWANGALVPILSASETELDILCPDSAPGSPLEFVVQTGHGAANLIRTQAASAAPGLFSLDGSGAGQGRVFRNGAGGVAIIRNYLVTGQPVQAGDQVISYGTGLGNLSNISVKIGDEVTAASVTPVQDHPGLYQVLLTVPPLAHNNGIPLLLSGNTPEGTIVNTNIVNIAVESNVW